MDQSGHPMSYLLCYRWAPWSEDLDVGRVWEFVQQHQGHIEHVRDTVDFYIPDRYESFLLIKFPGLPAVPALDYIV